MNEAKEEPLESEQANRGKWRGGQTAVREEDAAGHSVPESERDNRRMKSGGDGDEVAHPRTIAPPD